MDKNFRTVLVLWMVLAICWLFLKIGSEIKRDRMLDEAIEQASEASEQASEASERAKRDLERTRQAYREKWGKEPSF